jgi:hypothetical protein
MSKEKITPEKITSSTLPNYLEQSMTLQLICTVFGAQTKKWFGAIKAKTSAGTIPAKSCLCDSDYFGLCGKESDSIRNRIRVRRAQILRK